MDENHLSRAILKFSAKMLKELEKKDSVVSSPLSAETLLALLALGDSGDVHEELLAALEIPDEAIRTAFPQLLQSLNKLPGVTLQIANKLYVRQGLGLDEQFEKDGRDVFETEIEQMDFDNADEAAKEINTWAENKTNQKIKRVISGGDLDATTQMILINAIYFLGTWKHQFPKKSTHDAPFYVDANTTIVVPTMSSPEEHFKTGHTDLCKILVLPYKGDESNMVILLPHSIDGVDELLEKLAEGHDLVSDLKSLGTRKVKAFIPKFKIETEIKLKPILHKLGIRSIFTTGMDSILQDNQRVSVSEAVQKAYIEVNEEGTEAAAVTAVKRLIKKKGPTYFTVDRPFIYLLTGSEWTCLFIGVYRGDSTAKRVENQQWTEDSDYIVISCVEE